MLNFQNNIPVECTARAQYSRKILYPQIAGDNLAGVDTANICTRDRNKGGRAGDGDSRWVEGEGDDARGGSARMESLCRCYRGTGSLI